MLKKRFWLLNFIFLKNVLYNDYVFKIWDIEFIVLWLLNLYSRRIYYLDYIFNLLCIF